MNKYQPADPRARRMAIWMVLIAAVPGLAAILVFNFFQHDLRSWLQRNMDFLLDHTELVLPVGLVMVVPLLVAGIYLFVLGRRTVRARRFPPPGYSVTRQTRAFEGEVAVFRGRMVQLLSLIVLAVTLAIPVVFWSIFRSLAATGGAS